MTPNQHSSIADLTTLRVGGPAQEIWIGTSADEIVEFVDTADASDTDLFILGGGSNVVVADDGWAGPLLLIRSKGIERNRIGDSEQVTVAAGEVWGEFVDTAVAAGLSGVEALAGIPGLVGATPIQNVGAYGQEVASTVNRVRAWDRYDRQAVELSKEDCEFSYRNSLFKRDPKRFVILSVTFALACSESSAPIRYSELARKLGVEVGDQTSVAATRTTVLQLRSGKGMVLDPMDSDTFSAGSFFTNPILSTEDAGRLPSTAPRFPAPNGIKTSAAWLIENAGFAKGHGSGRARLSSKHTLALTNYENATTEDVLDLAREVRSGVESKFGVRLEPEPVLVGCRL